MGRPRQGRGTWWVPFTLGLALLAVGGLVFSGGWQERQTYEVLSAHGTTLGAVIVAVREQGREHSATLRWTTAAGRVVQVRGVDVDGPLVVGRPVPVVVDPDDPEDFVVSPLGDGYRAGLGLGVLLGFGGVVALLRGLWLLRSQR